MFSEKTIRYKHYNCLQRSFKKKAFAKLFFSYKMRDSYGGWVAQLVEQRIENPRVGGSIPSPATTRFNKIGLSDRY